MRCNMHWKYMFSIRFPQKWLKTSWELFKQFTILFKKVHLGTLSTVFCRSLAMYLMRVFLSTLPPGGPPMSFHVLECILGGCVLFVLSPAYFPLLLLVSHASLSSGHSRRREMEPQIRAPQSLRTAVRQACLFLRPFTPLALSVADHVPRGMVELQLETPHSLRVNNTSHSLTHS